MRGVNRKTRMQDKILLLAANDSVNISLLSTRWTWAQ